MDTAKTQQEGAAEEDPTDTMESLLAQQTTLSHKLSSKKVTWVKVIQVTKDQVLVDVGEKNEGVVAFSEFSGANALPKVGQRIPVVLLGPGRDGVARLSYQRARAEIAWEAVVKAFGEKARVRGRIQSAIKGGFLVDLGGLSGFLPASHADLRPVRNSAGMVGMGVRCLIIELNEGKRQVVLSRKRVLEEELAKKRSKLLNELRLGDVRIGRIVGVTPHGLVVDIGGLEGFVCNADIAWGASPNGQAPQRGSKVRVKVLAKGSVGGEQSQRVSLGIKQLTPNPADLIRKKYPPKSVVHGKIVETGPLGVKILLTDKRAALSPSSESDPESGYKLNEPVSAIVYGVDPNTFELLVSLKKFEEIRDRKKVAQYLKAPQPLTLGQLLSPDGEK